MKQLLIAITLFLTTPLHCPRTNLRSMVPALQKMTASWYGPGFEGRRTASEIRFYAALPIVAHKTLPLGTILRIRRGSIEVFGIVLDRGPWIRHRDLDLSSNLADKLQLTESGVGEVEVAVVGFEPSHQWMRTLRSLTGSL